MAILSHSDPAIIGRHGNVIVYQWRGKTIMRTMPKKSIHVPTPAQLAHRAKFSLVARFLSPLRELIANAYTDVPAQGRMRLSAASTYHLQHAISGDYPNFNMDYPKVVVSRGALATPKSCAMSANPKIVELSWRDNSGDAVSSSADQLFVVLYQPELQTVRLLANIATRETGRISIARPVDGPTGPLHIWAGFSNAQTKAWSTSVYLGIA